MGTIRFSLRSDKADKDGKQPIQLTYQISGKREYFRTKERIWSKSWSQDEQKAIYLDRKTVKELLPGKAFNLMPTIKEIEEINGNLNSLVIQIRNAEKKKELDNITEYTPEEIIDCLRTRRPKLKVEKQVDNIFEYIDKFIKKYEETKKPGSLQVYKSLKNHLKAYQEKEHVRIKFADLDSNFFESFKNFLATPRVVKMKIKTGQKKLLTKTPKKKLVENPKERI